MRKLTERNLALNNEAERLGIDVEQQMRITADHIGGPESIQAKPHKEIKQRETLENTIFRKDATTNQMLEGKKSLYN